MNIDFWLSWYNQILQEFGFPREEDEKSAKKLNKILKNKNGLRPHDIPMKKRTIIFGAGPSLKENIQVIINSGLADYTLIAADGATTALLEEGIIPEIIVTDLDGRMEDILTANKKGALVVVHAHGHNQDKVEKYLPRLNKVMGTTQSRPLEYVYNFGGFTDGDRCLFLAVELGAKFIVLAGMDFGEMVTRYSRPELGKEVLKADEVKLKKLIWAKRLVEWVAKYEDVKIYNLSQGVKIIGVPSINSLNDIKEINKF